LSSNCYKKIKLITTPSHFKYISLNFGTSEKLYMVSIKGILELKSQEMTFYV